MDIQKILFEAIKNKSFSNLCQADVVADALKISNDSAYRRLRGEKKLSINEMITLCQHFNISVDAIINYQSDNVLFKYTPLDLSNMDNYYTYMDNLSKLIEAISSSKEKEIIFTGLDIPIPNFMPFKELTLFKVYTWFQSVNNLQITYEQFISDLDAERLLTYYNKITNAYKQIPSTEVWTNNTIDVTLHLLEYYAEVECFEDKKKTLPILCRQLLELIENIEKNTERESKEYNGKKALFRMYLSPIDIVNDFMIIKRDGVSTTGIKLYTINSLFTNNDFFSSEVEKWVKNTVSKSLSLSGTSERERFKFFRQLKNKIHNLSEKIAHL
jgi:hypothetical protein